jgi:hypothetical protein
MGGESMDPDAALAKFAAAYDAALKSERETGEMSADDLREAVEAASTLFYWLARGGFAPDWKAYK